MDQEKCSSFDSNLIKNTKLKISFTKSKRFQENATSYSSSIYNLN